MRQVVTGTTDWLISGRPVDTHALTGALPVHQAPGNSETATTKRHNFTMR